MAILLALAGAGCGRLGADHKGMRALAGTPVDRRAVDRYPAGAPQRAVLEWFGALQRRDAAAASSFYSADAHVRLPVIRFLRVASSAFFAGVQPPRIVGLREAGDRATVYTVLESRWSAPDGRTAVYLRPQAFDLLHSLGRWQIADNYFLESTPTDAPGGPCPVC